MKDYTFVPLFCAGFIVNMLTNRALILLDSVVVVFYELLLVSLTSTRAIYILSGHRLLSWHLHQIHTVKNKKTNKKNKKKS